MKHAMYGVSQKCGLIEHQTEFKGNASNKKDVCLELGENDAGSSYLDAKTRFSRLNKSLKYPSEYRTGNSHDMREKNAILKSLNYLAPNSKVLDLPCGTGRLTNLLIGRGYMVRGADVSNNMTQMALKNHQEYMMLKSPNTQSPVVDFDVVDIMRTSYKDKEFNAVVCNRLFHHFTESETRLTALRELCRITSDVVVVSFFNSKSFDGCWRRIRNWMRRRHPKDRLPIPLKQFNTELNLAGLEMVDCISARRFISPLCYVVARPQKQL